ncbi:MAG: hypothetical protein LBK46_09890 [Oscillospiraceae bacterium]|jgi:hypothetical protein|nr:hypothetical protein [Oscillospiraceae bacterium]
MGHKKRVAQTTPQPTPATAPSEAGGFAAVLLRTLVANSPIEIHDIDQSRLINFLLRLRPWHLVCLIAVAVVAGNLWLNKDVINPSIKMDVRETLTSSATLVINELNRVGRLIYAPASNKVKSSTQADILVKLDNLIPDTEYKAYVEIDWKLLWWVPVTRSAGETTFTTVKPPHMADDVLKLMQPDDYLLIYPMPQGMDHFRYADERIFTDVPTVEPYAKNSGALLVELINAPMEFQDHSPLLTFYLYAMSGAPHSPDKLQFVLRASDGAAFMETAEPEWPDWNPEGYNSRNFCYPLQGLLSKLYSNNDGSWPEQPLTLEVYADDRLLESAPVLISILQ